MNMAENKLCDVIENGGVQYSPVMLTDWGKAISTWGTDKAYEWLIADKTELLRYLSRK